MSSSLRPVDCPRGGSAAPQARGTGSSTAAGQRVGALSCAGDPSAALSALASPSPSLPSTSKGPPSPAPSSVSAAAGVGQQHPPTRPSPPPPSQAPQRNGLSPPATTSSPDTSLRLPPVSAPGTGTGNRTTIRKGAVGIDIGSAFGSGIDTTRGKQEASAVSSALGPAYHQLPDTTQAASSSSISFPIASSTSPGRPQHSQSSSSRHLPASSSPSRSSSTHSASQQDRRPRQQSHAAPDAVVLDTSPASTLGAKPLFQLPSIPTSTNDFASVPYLNLDFTSTSTQDTMSQPPPQQYAATPQRRTTGYGDEQQQQQGSSQYQQHGAISPREYAASGGAPHITLDQAPSGPPSYQNTSSSYTSSGSAVPSVLQPGGSTARPPAMGVNTAPSLLQGAPTQQQEYQNPTRPSLNLSHSYSRSSPAAAFDGSNPGYSPYTPTTPSGAGPSSAQYMSPTDRSYNAPGSQRNISHTPLGLADIRPRADSSLSDGMPGAQDFPNQNAPPGPSNYMAPWTTYAFDWCKWTPQGNSAGKVAIGSYLEDGHNFVSTS